MMFQKSITKVVLSAISAKIIRQKSSILQIFSYILTAFNKIRCKFSAIREFINKDCTGNLFRSTCQKREHRIQCSKRHGTKIPAQYCSKKRNKK